jgi:hypothetical protein
MYFINAFFFCHSSGHVYAKRFHEIFSSINADFRISYMGPFSGRAQYVSLLFARTQLIWPEDFGILSLQVEIGSVTLHLFHKFKKCQTSEISGSISVAHKDVLLTVGECYKKWDRHHVYLLLVST